MSPPPINSQIVKSGNINTVFLLRKAFMIAICVCVRVHQHPVDKNMTPLFSKAPPLCKKKGGLGTLF